VALGQFNRRESPTQTATTALQQVVSGEIWGRTARGGLGPVVQAYTGKLDNYRGIEFTTMVDPHPSTGSPFEVRWYLHLTNGVELRCANGEDFACIIAAVTNMQP
jgi:hypothetical protein